MKITVILDGASWWVWCQPAEELHGPYSSNNSCPLGYGSSKEEAIQEAMASLSGAAKQLGHAFLVPGQGIPAPAPRDEGGHAFPTFPTYDPRAGGYMDGMSMRDYFAAHAPAEPWPWFDPEMPAKPEEICHKGHHGGGTCYYCLPENLEERSAWETERNRQRFVQWPYAWADAQIKARQQR